jgi:hypothetical protein
VDESSYRAELEALPTKEVYLRARRRAVRRLDVRFFWRLLRSIPAAEAAAGEVQEAQADVRSGIARLNDLRDAGEGKLGEALRPLYVDYLAKHAPEAASRSLRAIDRYSDLIQSGRVRGERGEALSGSKPPAACSPVQVELRFALTNDRIRDERDIAAGGARPRAVRHPGRRSDAPTPASAGLDL